MIRRPPRSTLFPTRRSSDLVEADYAQRGPAYSNMVSLEFHVSLPLFGEHRQNPVIAEKLARVRSEEHTSELQSPCNLVCRLLLEKKKTNRILIWFRSQLRMT